MIFVIHICQSLYMSKLREKIDELRTKLDLSYSQFADEVKINRSVMSHILSGRNKPSLDIVQKIVARFPVLEYNWIDDSSTFDPDVIQHIINENNFSRDSDFQNIDKEITEIHEPKATKRELQQIILVYNDDSFKVLSAPEKSLIANIFS